MGPEIAAQIKIDLNLKGSCHYQILATDPVK